MRDTERVTLGLPGPWAEDYREAANHYTTKIGGLPDWPALNIISPDMINCRLCGKNLCLLAQVYSPILSDGSKIEDRTIYVLGCPRPSCASCTDTWRTLRVQKGMKHNESQNQCHIGMQEEKMFEKQFTLASSSSDDWWATGDASDDDMDLMNLSQAISEASVAVRCTKKQNQKTLSDILPKMNSKLIGSDIPVLPCFYLYNEEEQSFNERNDLHKQCSSLSIEDSLNIPADSCVEERWDDESYEYDRALGADRTYLKFKKRLEAYPEQCIRYSHGGRPLVAEKLSEEPISCENCGAKRCFEMQLMPPLLFFLQQAADDKSTLLSLKHWNWMTIIIYTCSKNCFTQSSEDRSVGENWTVAEEPTIAQWE